MPAITNSTDLMMVIQAFQASAGGKQRPTGRVPPGTVSILGPLAEKQPLVEQQVSQALGMELN